MCRLYQEIRQRKYALYCRSLQSCRPLYTMSTQVHRRVPDSPLGGGVDNREEFHDLRGYLSYRTYPCPGKQAATHPGRLQLEILRTLPSILLSKTRSCTVAGREDTRTASRDRDVRSRKKKRKSRGWRTQGRHLQQRLSGHRCEGATRMVYDKGENGAASPDAPLDRSGKHPVPCEGHG